MKKLMLVLLSGMLFLAFTAAPTSVDAKPKTSYKSPSKSYTPTTPKDGGVSNSNNGSTTKSPTTSTTPGAKTGGFFGGGSFMKGMLIGGLAGMMFGGLFGNMGMLGNILGLMINVLAIVAVFMLLRSLIGYFMQKRQKPDQKRY